MCIVIHLIDLSQDKQTLARIPQQSHELLLSIAGLYDQWEMCREEAGRLSARSIEKALRWDGITGVESGHGYEHIRSFVEDHYQKAK
jgi:hypothetical protein